MGDRVSTQYTNLGFREGGFREEKRTAAGKDEVLKLRDARLEGGGHDFQRRGGGASVAGVHGRGDGRRRGRRRRRWG